ncbi:hypothetical protein ABKN59_004992 [Abortiporus biennis]
MFIPRIPSIRRPRFVMQCFFFAAQQNSGDVWYNLTKRGRANNPTADLFLISKSDFEVLKRSSQISFPSIGALKTFQGARMCATW